MAGIKVTAAAMQTSNPSFPDTPISLDIKLFAGDGTTEQGSTQLTASPWEYTFADVAVGDHVVSAYWTGTTYGQGATGTKNITTTNDTTVLAPDLTLTQV